MSEATSPVQPLDSAGGSDQRLANMLAGAKDSPAAPAAELTPAKRVDEHLCPNCKNTRDAEVELDGGKCPECGYNTSVRLFS